MRATIARRRVRFAVQPLLERRAHDAVDRTLHLGVVEAVLGLPLELRLGDVDDQDATMPSRMSSAVSVTPRGASSWVSM